MDLLRVCPEELSSEPVAPKTKRKQRRSARKPGRREVCAIQSQNKNTYQLLHSRSQREFDVTDEMHCLHARFRCQGQPLPLLEGVPQIDMSQCSCSAVITAGELIADLPQPAHSHRVECVLEGARVIAIWQGCGTLAEKVAWILDPFHRRVTPKSVALSYAFFRSRCLHVSVMAGAVPPDGIMRHPEISGWSCDITQIFEAGWRIATRISWKTAQSAVGREHRKMLILVPECLHRLKFAAQGQRDTKLFHYKEFREIHLRKTDLFDDNLGKIVVVLPPVEPVPGSWLPLVHAWSMWLQCGRTVFLIAGPRPQDINSWYRVAHQARVHMNGFLEEHQELIPQVVDKLMVENGVVDSNSPAYAVAVLDNENEWLPERQARLFHEFLTRQLSPHTSFEPLRSSIPRRICTGEPSAKPGDAREYPGIKDGAINKRMLRRREQRKRRSEARAAAKAMSDLALDKTE